MNAALWLIASAVRVGVFAMPWWLVLAFSVALAVVWPWTWWAALT